MAEPRRFLFFGANTAAIPRFFSFGAIAASIYRNEGVTCDTDSNQDTYGQTQEKLAMVVTNNDRADDRK